MLAHIFARRTRIKHKRIFCERPWQKYSNSFVRCLCCCVCFVCRAYMQHECVCEQISRTKQRTVHSVGQLFNTDCFDNTRNTFLQHLFSLRVSIGVGRWYRHWNCANCSDTRLWINTHREPRPPQKPNQTIIHRTSSVSPARAFVAAQRQTHWGWSGY